ncbi:hypothetical protein J2W97_002224 [Paenibacillus jamilae]|nr:hypothetical protein [Paenibacillus jamilae]
MSSPSNPIRRLFHGEIRQHMTIIICYSVNKGEQGMAAVAVNFFITQVPFKWYFHPRVANCYSATAIPTQKDHRSYN